MNKEIRDFWKWFKRKEKHIFNNIVEEADDIAVSISEHLKRIHQDLAFEISFEMVNDRRNFVISADGIIDLFELVIEITNTAPDFSRWNIIPDRKSVV